MPTFPRTKIYGTIAMHASVTAASLLGIPLGNNTTVREAARFDCRETDCRACGRVVSVRCPSPRPEQSRTSGTARQDWPRSVHPQRFSLELQTSSRPRVPANTPRYCVPSIGTRLAWHSPFWFRPHLDGYRSQSQKTGCRWPEVALCSIFRPSPHAGSHQYEDRWSACSYLQRSEDCCGLP